VRTRCRRALKIGAGRLGERVDHEPDEAHRQLDLIGMSAQQQHCTRIVTSDRLDHRDPSEQLTEATQRAISPTNVHVRIQSLRCDHRERLRPTAARTPAHDVVVWEDQIFPAVPAEPAADLGEPGLYVALLRGDRSTPAQTPQRSSRAVDAAQHSTITGHPCHSRAASAPHRRSQTATSGWGSDRNSE
jgi:hypothetical protein